MPTAHLNALKRKHLQLEKNIHDELAHPARNEFLIERLKKERLRLREEIERNERRSA